MLLPFLWCIFCVFTFTTKPVTEATAEQKCTRINDVAATRITALRKSLFCSNATHSAPLDKSGGNRVKINIELVRFRIRYLPEADWFEFTTYILLMWVDPRLKWDKEKDYPNITRIRTSVEETWMPRILLDSGHEIHIKEATVQYFGATWSLKWTALSGNCKPVYFSWGDRRECTIAFGISPRKDVFISEAGDREHSLLLARGSVWGVVNVEQTYPRNVNSTGKTPVAPASKPWKYGPSYFEARVTLQRNFVIHDAVIFAPATVLGALLLASTWLPPRSNSRVALLSLVVIIEVFMFHQASEEMPYLADRLIDIVALYRDLIICTGAAIAEWLISYSIACRRPSASRLSEGLQTVHDLSKTYSVLSVAMTIFAIPASSQKDVSGGTERTLSSLLDRLTFICLGVVLFILEIRVDAWSRNAADELLYSLYS